MKKLISTEQSAANIAQAMLVLGDFGGHGSPAVRLLLEPGQPSARIQPLPPAVAIEHAKGNEHAHHRVASATKRLP